MNSMEIGWKGVYWMCLAKVWHQLQAFVNMVVMLQVSWKARNFLTVSVII